MSGSRESLHPESKQRHILVLHGPNLNLLGKRDVSLYGSLSIDALNAMILSEANKLGVEVEIHQSNDEAWLVQAIQKASSRFDGIILNPAALGYYSIALKDALLAVHIPVIEVHLSNIHARETFRRNTVTAETVIGQIAGLKEFSYLLALKYLAQL